MDILLLLLVTVGVSTQSVAQKAYNMKVKGSAYCFTLGSACFALPVFLLSSGGNLCFNADTALWSVLFAAAYSTGLIASLHAIRTGPLSLTSLFLSFSLVIPTLIGLIFLGEPVSEWLIIGIVLLFASLVLVNIEKKTEKRNITLKWGVCALLAFVGNGACSTLQKLQQLSSGGQYKSELMILALLITVTVMATLSGVTERKNAPSKLKGGLPYYAVCGLANGFVNYLVLVLSNRMDASVMFPVISAGGVVLAALVAIFLYKEKLQLQQWIGILLGTLAIIALNL